MMMQSFRFSLFLLSGLLLTLTIYAQPVSEQAFKTYKDSLNTVIKDLRKQVNEGDNALKKADKLYEKAEQHISLAERFDSIFLNLAGLALAIIGAILGILGYNFINIRENVKKYKEELLSEFATQTKNKKALIEKALRIVEIENEIRETKKVLIISKKDDNNEPFEKLTKKFGFKQVAVSKIEDDFGVVDFNDYDLVILDNENTIGYHWKLSDNNLKNKLIQLLTGIKNQNKKFIYFGKHDKDADGGLIREQVFKEGGFSIVSDISNLEYKIFDLFK